MCKNSLTLIEYAYKKDKYMLSEGLGSFIKKHIGKILICIVLLTICLPFVASSIFGISASGGILGAIGGVFTTIGGAFMKLISYIPGVGETAEKLGSCEIAPIESSVTPDQADWPGLNPSKSNWPGVDVKSADWPGKTYKKADWPGLNPSKSNWTGVR